MHHHCCRFNGVYWGPLLRIGWEGIDDDVGNDGSKLTWRDVLRGNMLSGALGVGVLGKVGEVDVWKEGTCEYV